MGPLERWLRTFPRYQLRWIYEPARFAAVVKSRQIGFSHSTAAGALRNALVERRTQIILSASQALSDEVLEKTKSHAEILADLGLRRAGQITVCNRNELRWEGGGRVIALPANPRTARSFSGDVWLDEAAYFEDIDGIRDAIFPIVSRGDYRLRVVSTPNGASGWFYDTVQNPPPGWAVHRVSLDDAIADGFEVDKGKLLELCGGDKRVFEQWYNCSFLSGELQYIPTDLAARAINWKEKPPQSLDPEMVFAGLDVGRHHDLTALTVVYVANGSAWTKSPITCLRTEFAKQKAIIRDARARIRWRKLHIDSTGLGEQLAEEFVEMWGDDEVVPVKFTNDSKADLATRLLRWVRDNRLRLPKTDEGQKLYSEMIALKRMISDAGNITYEVPRTAQGHGDRLWSLMLALKGAGEPVSPFYMGQKPIAAFM